MIVSDFARTLSGLVTKAGASKHALAQFAGLDSAYVWRLACGRKRNPSRDVVLRIGLALVHASRSIEAEDIDRLLLAADYRPLIVIRN